MTPEQIKYMVNRFLSWKLPKDFRPDAGISFKETYNEHTAHPMKHEPTGTNLFDARQAEEMVRYMVDGLFLPEVYKTTGLSDPVPFIPSDWILFGPHNKEGTSL